jgi:hypothetical protein
MSILSNKLFKNWNSYNNYINESITKKTMIVNNEVIKIVACKI